jgi:hypothetical protein
MARDGHGLPKVPLGPAMPYPSMPWERATPGLASLQGLSGGLPTRPTRPGLGAPKARGPQGLDGPKVGGPQGLPAQWLQRAGVHKAWNSPRAVAPTIGGPHGLAGPMVWGPHGLGAQRVSGRIYETKPIIAVFCFLWFRFVQRMQS